MSVVRRGAVGAVVAGLVLLGSPAWAQEDPCAPGPDGQLPEMCQSGPTEPASDTGTVGMEPEDPCLGSRPVEPGDGVVDDGGGSAGSAGSAGSEGIAEGEPAPGTEPEPAQPGETKPEPAPDGEARTEPAPDEPMPPSESTGEPDQPVSHDPGAEGEDVIVCAFGIPVSDTAVPESATSGRGTATAGQLPRTGPYDGLLVLTAIGSGLVLVGAGATLATRRRAQV